MNQNDSNVIYVEAEQAVLGAILKEGDLIQDCTFPVRVLRQAGASIDLSSNASTAKEK
jgi:hypothetical protein